MFGRKKLRSSGIMVSNHTDKLLNRLAKRHKTSRSIVVAAAVADFDTNSVDMTKLQLEAAAERQGVKNAD